MVLLCACLRMCPVTLTRRLHPDGRYLGFISEKTTFILSADLDRNNLSQGDGRVDSSAFRLLQFLW